MAWLGHSPFLLQCLQEFHILGTSLQHVINKQRNLTLDLPLHPGTGCAILPLEGFLALRHEPHAWMHP
eukprot:12904058-Prorocentrum_lima.AAC.1